jgi:hypothetical protein
MNRFACAAALLLSASLSAHPQSSMTPAPATAQADALFKAAKFAAAASAYTRVTVSDPKNFDANLQLARIALLENHSPAAEAAAKKALALQPASIDAKILLAEALYRRDDFQHAAAAMTGVTAEDAQKLHISTLGQDKLASFSGLTPYQLSGPGDSTTLPFVVSDPLPLVNVTINGKPVVFFIDTGGAEIALDTDFARELGIPLFKGPIGVFSGGQTAPSLAGRIDSIGVGDWLVKNVPVQTIALRQLSHMLGTKQIDGIVGTIFLSHFLSTIDYRNHQLVLRRKSQPSLDKLLAASPHAVKVPIWIGGDHFLLGWGQVNALPPALLFIDTGVAGAGVKLAPSVIKQAGITLNEKDASAGQGGGGSFTTVPYVVPLLALGSIKEKNVTGIYDGPFPWENSLGFFCAGSVGHDFFKPYSVTFDFTNMQMIFE